MIVVGGKIIAEGYFPPFDKDFLNRLYSSVKTYVAVAVGMLVTAGKIKLSDKIIGFFPEYDANEVSPEARTYTVEGALTMPGPFVSVRAGEKPTKQDRNTLRGCSCKSAGSYLQLWRWCGRYGESGGAC